MAPPAEPAPSGGAPPTVPPRVQAAGSSLPAPALTESASAAPYQADDHDADLQRAMAASMAEDRGSTRAAHGDMDEEEQLMRVLAESAKVQQPPTNHRDRRQHVRRDGEPVALVSGVPTYRATALALQAMFAAAPIRDAILGFPMPDDRTASLENYWAGASPSQRVERPSPPSAMVAQDAWRDVDSTCYPDTSDPAMADALLVYACHHALSHLARRHGRRIASRCVDAIVAASRHACAAGEYVGALIKPIWTVSFTLG